MWLRTRFSSPVSSLVLWEVTGCENKTAGRHLSWLTQRVRSSTPPGTIYFPLHPSATWTGRHSEESWGHFVCPSGLVWCPSFFLHLAPAIHLISNAHQTLPEPILSMWSRTCFGLANAAWCRRLSSSFGGRLLISSNTLSRSCQSAERAQNGCSRWKEKAK